jgi:hypothetical protein
MKTQEQILKILDKLIPQAKKAFDPYNIGYIQALKDVLENNELVNNLIKKHSDTQEPQP